MSTKVGRIVLLVLLACLTAEFSQAQTYSVLYSFAGGPDGAHPQARLTFDSAGNLYGTTGQGGTSNAGTIFKLDPSGQESWLYSFTGGTDGGSPVAALMIGANGNLYGTAQAGGSTGQGVAFELAPGGNSVTLLHVFQARKDGNAPASELIQDSAGNLFGTTVSGGRSKLGTVFRIDSSGNEKVLYSFRGATDGGYSYAGLIRDTAGNFYGTTSGRRSICGTVFKMTPSGAETVLHSFCARTDGALLRAGLIMDSAGMLYGTTIVGGAHGAGTVFKVDSATRKETILYSFTGGADGGDPYSSLLMDSSGNLYGTTYYGGTFGYGTIFKLDPTGNETVLYSFTGGSDGLGPMAGLVWDGAGNLYGTTLYGGTHGAGVVFKLVP